MLEATREDDVAVEPAASWRHLRERHANLKCDTRLFGEDKDRTDRVYRRRYELVKFTYDRLTAREVMFEVMQAARVRLVTVRKDASARGALPEGTVSPARGGRAHA